MVPDIEKQMKRIQKRGIECKDWKERMRNRKKGGREKITKKGEVEEEIIIRKLKIDFSIL